MHGDQRTSTLSKCRRYCLNCDILADGVHISHHRCRAAHNHGTGRGDKSPTWHDDLIARPNSQSTQSRLKGNCTVHECYGIFCPNCIRVLTLKVAALLSCPIVNFSGNEYAFNRLNFLLSEVRPQRERLGTQRSATVNGKFGCSIGYWARHYLGLDWLGW